MYKGKSHELCREKFFYFIRYLTDVEIWDKRTNRKRDTTVFNENTVNMVSLQFIMTDCLKRNPPGLRVFSGQNYEPKLFTL